MRLAMDLPDSGLAEAQSALTGIMDAHTHPPSNAVVCRCWKDILKAFQSFPSQPEDWLFDDQGEPFPADPLWIFRGQANAGWHLSPTIERNVGKVSWVDAERTIFEEFSSRAHLYVKDPLPSIDDRALWWSLMQHLEMPTRLLDFTFSPYVALFFALQQFQPLTGFAKVWAIDLHVLREASRSVYRQLEGMRPGGLNPNIPKGDLVKKAMSSTSITNWRLDHGGFVVALEATQANPRLAYQQGLFLMNGAFGSNFEQSLDGMMASQKDWRTLIYVDRECRAEVLRRLFQMNIHEFSLFPDVTGLGRYARLKAELFCRQQAMEDDE